MRSAEYALGICVLILSQAYAQQAKCSSSECINIYECKPIVDMINAAPKPLSTEFKQQLIDYQCARIENDIKVCCPNHLTPDTDLTTHRNYHLIPSNSCGSLNLDDKLIGGEIAGLFEFPWMVLISYRLANGRLDFGCGGSIINDRYILTAAHCITLLKKKTIAGVRLGEYNISSQVDCEELDGYQNCADAVQDMQVEDIITHPLYNAELYEFDIGLLRLRNKIRFKGNIAPVCLPIANSLKTANLKHYTVCGWGKTENSYQSNVLLKINVPAVSLNACAKVYKTVSITDRQICAGGTTMKASCTGDSGSPMQAVRFANGDSRYVQYGLVSFGPEGCIGTPGVYTRITSYLDWILDNIKP